MRGVFLFFLLLNFSLAASLKELEEAALKRFYALKAKRHLLKRADYGKKSAFSSFLPKLYFSYSTFRAKRQAFTVRTPFFSEELLFVKRSFYRAELVLSQELFNGVSLARLGLADWERELQERELKALENEVRGKVREEYLKALLLKAQVRVVKAQLKRLKEHLRRVKALYEEGVVPFKDLLETKVKLLEVKSALREKETLYEEALDRLSYLTGVRIKELERPKEPKAEGSVEENPRLLALKKKAEGPRWKARLLKASFLPSLRADLLLQRTDESPLLPKNRYYLSLSLSWPLFEGGGRYWRIKEAREEELALLEEVRRLREELKLKERSLRRRLAVLEEEIKTAEERLKEAKEHYRLAIEKYKNGLAVNAEVLDAEAYLTSAEENLKVKRLKKLLTLYKLAEVYGR